MGVERDNTTRGDAKWQESQPACRVPEGVRVLGGVRYAFSRCSSGSECAAGGVARVTASVRSMRAASACLAYAGSSIQSRYAKQR